MYKNINILSHFETLNSRTMDSQVQELFKIENTINNI